MTTDKTQMMDNLALGLGALVWWDLFNTKTTPAALRKILKSEGENPSVVPDLNSVSEIRDTARSWKQGRGNAARYRTEVVFEDADSLMVGILTHKRVNDKEVRWEQVDTVVFDKAMDKWTTVGKTEEATRFIAQADSDRTYLDHDFIRPVLIQAPLKAFGAFSVRQHSGGIYYVPKQHQDDVEKLARIVSKIGDSALHITHVSDTEASRTSIGGAAKNFLMGNVADGKKVPSESLAGIRERLADWTKKSKEQRPRADSLAKALGELRTLKSYAELYSESLHLGLGELETEIDDAVEQANALLGLAKDEGDGKRKARGVSEKLKTQIKAAIDKHGMELTVEQLADSGFPEWAGKYRTFWTRHAGATLTEVNLRGRLSKKKGGTTVVFTKLDAPAPAPVEAAPEAAA
ncbi:MAG: hypothetical protein HRU00_17365 [Myxococcales bacterium]|nr:hypothetical protein [Myxococcales bacterium]